MPLCKLGNTKVLSKPFKQRCLSRLLRKNFTDFTIADNDFAPICLKNKEWVFIKEDIEEAL